jgi:hypothetical protein
VLEGIKILAGILTYNLNSFFNLFFLDERGAPFICLFYSLWIFHFYSLFDLAEASAMLKNFFFRAARRSTGPVSLRHLVSHSGSERSSATYGIKVDKPFKNAMACTYRGILT